MTVRAEFNPFISSQFGFVEETRRGRLTRIAGKPNPPGIRSCSDREIHVIHRSDALAQIGNARALT
jgi:hypothetical protein